jgi:hypothetical protein
MTNLPVINKSMYLSSKFMALASFMLLLALFLSGFNRPAEASVHYGISNESGVSKRLSRPDTDSVIFLPYVSRQANPPRALGTVNVISGPIECDTTTSQSCYEIQVACPEVTDKLNATIKIGEPTSQDIKGTILFFSGYTGVYYWEDSAFLLVDDGVELFSNLQTITPNKNNPTILANLRTAGYRTVQVKWNSSWFQSKVNQPEGMARLACRPASVARWVYDNLHAADASKPFCATGHSNGASQVSYMLTHYGLANILSATVLESGPNWSYIEYACLNTPSYAYLFANDGERNTIDKGFGFITPINSGPCYKQDVTWTTNFQEASVISAQGTYTYPRTFVGFLFGELDTGTTAAQGKEFYNRLWQDVTPWVSMQTIAGAGHDVTATTEGAQAMESTLLSECILR